MRIVASGSYYAATGRPLMRLSAVFGLRPLRYMAATGATAAHKILQKLPSDQKIS
jgi:hypothetical protein